MRHTVRERLIAAVLAVALGATPVYAIEPLTFPQAFDSAVPSPTGESVRLGAQRIKEVKWFLANVLGIPDGQTLQGAQHWLTHFSDVLTDFVVTGMLGVAPANSLTMVTPAGTAYVIGRRTVIPAAGSSFTYTASKDTYDDISQYGAMTHTAVANGAAAPAVAASSIRLQKVVTDGTKITGVTDLRGLTSTLSASVNATVNLTGGVTSVGNVATVVTNANLTGGVTSVGNAATVITNANLTGGVTSVGNAATVVTNANLTGGVTSVGNAATVVTNANLTGGVTSVGNVATVVTNANLTGGVTSVGNAATVITNANLTGGVTSVGNAATVVTNANLTGDVTSVGNATTIGAGKVTEAMQVLADNTTRNVSATAHGYAPKFPNNTTTFLRGDGTYVAPIGTLTAGTSLTQNPYAISTTVTQAHGLGAIPSFGVVIYLECITGELGYTAGDRVPIAGNNTLGDSSITRAFTVSFDATNIVLRTGSNLPYFSSKTDGSATVITAANWKIVAVPYKLN